jgi:hypothetical protein
LITVARDVDNHLNDNHRSEYRASLPTRGNRPPDPPASPDLINDLLNADLPSLLLSPRSDVNIFLISSLALKALLHRHHISGVDGLSVTQARYALLSHLLSGSCIGVCDGGI